MRTEMPASTTAKESNQSGLKIIVDTIMTEAAEKCEEIEVKCDEEYRILRRKEISEQGEIIERADQKRRKGVMKNDRVCYTKLMNNFRLARLKAKNDIYNDILKIVKERISNDASSKYQSLLEKSLTQAMYMLMEPEVYITCRKTDQTLISSVFSSAARTYEEKTRLRVTIGFAKKTTPDRSSAGGMIVSNKTGSISVNCSLDSRVDHVCQLAMPMIVNMLYSNVPSVQDSPKLILQRSMTPTSSAAADDPAGRLPEDTRHPWESKPTPESDELRLERHGIGSSTINIHAGFTGAPDTQTSVDHQSEDERNASLVGNEEVAPERKSTISTSPGSASPGRQSTISTSPGSTSPDSDRNRPSTTSPSPRKSSSPDKQQPSRKSE